MEHQTSLLTGQPDTEAIKQIQFYETYALQQDPRGYCVCTSEGKDSRVLGHLFRRAGVKHFYLHSITGIDPPELIYFQRKNFEAYRQMGYQTYDVMYLKSIWQLMLEKRIPPFRTIRYCCAELKEKRSTQQGSALLSFGVRKFESVNRMRRRNELEIVANGRRGENIILPFDNAENRRIFEFCYAQSEKRLNPIAYWTNADIWNYSKDVKLEQSQLYNEGFERLGCIGCPMARNRIRVMEFERWPKFKAQYVRTFDKMLAARIARGEATLDGVECGEDWFNWWITDVAHDKIDENQLSLYGEYL